MFVPVKDALINTVAFGSGPRTLLAHGGWTGSWELWAEPFELLQPRWRCVSYDHRGSGATRVDPARITLDAMVDDLFAVMEARGVDRCVLAGESRGAQVALIAAARHPERFEGLVLVAPSVSTDPPPPEFVAALREDYPGALDAFVDACLPEPGTDHLRKWGRDILGRADAESAVALLECAFELPDVARLTMPVVVIHGTLDVIAPPWRAPDSWRPTCPVRRSMHSREWATFRRCRCRTRSHRSSMGVSVAGDDVVMPIGRIP